MSDFLARISNYSPKRLALLADELNSRAERLEQARREPIAIVGIGCRFPGGANGPERYWQLLHDGVDAITEVPPDRFDIDAHFDPDPDRAGKLSTRWGGFVGPVDGFDAAFFGVSPREAQSMDPQQRLLLEVTWRALEHAGIAPPSLEGSRTGVYLGLSAGDYWQLLKANGLAAFDAYTASGVAHSIASGRLSYVLGLRGPSVSIDTACSSSLVAIHHAVHSLRRGECDMALAGGVNLILSPDITIALSRAHMMAPDGRCKAFDARADGFVRGEGCGMLVLKRLRDAQAVGDRVLAVIRGTAANQDGRSNGLTAPNGPSQEAVLRDALDDAGIAAPQVGFVETHGTGTSLGDPIEVQALAKVLGAGRDPAQALLIGSVKANVGHLEAAAGVAGLIKLVLVLQHGEIPAQLHLHKPNPFIPWDELPVRAPTALTAWTPAGPRIGGISSFGFSGTNVHMVLEQAPASTVAPPSLPARPLQVFTVSARSDSARDELARRYAELLAAPGAALGEIAQAASTGRAHFAHRLAVVAADAADAAGKLRLHLARQDAPGLVTGTAPVRAPRVAFVFTGQGSQYAGMARALYDTEPVFRAELDRCDALLRDACGLRLLELLYPADGQPSSIDDTAHTQPALFALEYALARLWMSWGVKPHAVLGHSLGEYVAACIAGVCSLEDALALVAERGRLMGALPAGGAMAAVMADEARVQAATAPWTRELSIAAVNGPLNTVVSGAAAAVDALLAALQTQGVEASRLKVSHAFHSPLVEPMLDAFAAKAASLRWQRPQIDLISNVSGERAGAEVTQAGYWRTHVRAPVQFARAMRTLARLGNDIVLEIGPHPTLLGLGRACLEGDERRWLPSLRRGQPDADTLMSSLTSLYVAGVPIDWLAVHAGRGRAAVSLPGYPFQRERFWVEPAPVAPTAPAAPAAPAAPMLHPLLGQEVVHPFERERLFAAHLDLGSHTYLNDHRIHGRVLLPSPVHMEIACAVARQLWGPGAVELSDLTVHQALALDDEVPPTVQYAVAQPQAGVAQLRALWRSEAGWTELASARLQRPPATAAVSDLATLRAQLGQAVSVEAHYAWLASLGLEFGPSFRGIRSIACRDGEALAEVQLPPSLQSQASTLSLHPALLDACFHAVGAVLPADARGPDDAFLLMHVGRLTVHAPLGTSVWAHAHLREAAQPQPWTQRETFEASLRLYDDTGRTLAEFDGLHFKRASATALRGRKLPARVRAMLHEVAWRELPAPLTPAALHGAVRPLCDELAARHGLDRYGRFLPRLDALASAYIVQALRALAVPLRSGQRLQPRALMAELGVLARHERLLQRMLEILAEDGLLASDGEHWRVVGEWPPVDADALGAALQAEHPDADAEIVLTQRCARELAPVLRGRVDPLALLFPGGSLADTERLYRTSPPAQAYNSLIARVLAEVAAALPPGRTLRVLEVGAGTGSTTSYVLPALGAAHVEYTFTDVSPLFLNRAREKFATQPGMAYRLLDIGAAPAAQGFDAGSYDVVIGANVLHATADLARSLQHVRELLAPGGLLLLLEGTLPQRFGDLTVGLLDGWWAYEDTQRRRYALMPRPAWLQLLRDTGFGSAEALSGDQAHPVWSQQAVFIAQAPHAAQALSHWLVVPDRSGVAERLCGLLRARGHSAQTLPAEAPAGTLARALAQGPAPAGIVCLQALDHGLHADANADALMQDQQALVGSTVSLVQALAAAATAEPPVLWLVTRGAQSAQAAESADPAQATLWGLSHVIAIEQPQLRCRRVDLDPQADATQAAQALAAELLAPDGEDQLAYRGARRLVRRLLPATSEIAGLVPAEVSARGSHLVTGGLAGLGLRVAQWLVERGARHLVLMARRPPDAQALAQVDAWHAQGVQVLVAQGDVARAEDVMRVLAEQAASMPPLAGLVHAAGTLDDGVMTALTWERFERVMAAKVRGSWNLHRLTAGLDYFVMFSSGASLAGSAGQANHAAANAFEDALAWYRQARGQPALSINWGPWAEIGAAAQRHLKQPGSLDAIAPADGLAALEFLLRHRPGDARCARAQAAVLRTDWSHLRVAQRDGTLSALFRDLVPAAVNAAAAPGGEQVAAAHEPTLLERLAATVPNRRRAALRDHVRQLAAKVLGVARADGLPLDEPLRQLGLDSLMAVELRNLLGKAVARTLPATVTFDHPSISALVDHLAGIVLTSDRGADQAAAAQPAATSGTVPGPRADLDILNEDELAVQLMNRLDRLGRREGP